PHPRQDHAVGIAHDVVVCGHNRIRPDPRQCLLDRAKVAHAVVEDRDSRPLRIHHRTPLVDGIPCSESSIDTASRSARANALKHASILWWAFVPSSARRWIVSFALFATARKNSSVSSVSNPAMVVAGRSASKEQYGRPLTSIAHAPSASSIGTIA